MRVVEVEQGSPEWLAIRKGIPTASEFSRIVTKTGKPSASADEYIGELIDQLVHPEAEPEFQGNRHTERGHLLEPKARNWFRFITSGDVRTVGFVLSDDGMVGCSPDSLIYEDGAPVCGLEIKAPEGKKHVSWMLAGGIPDEHAQQVHGGMIVTGLRQWKFLSYCAGYKPFLVSVCWNETTDAYAKALEGFKARLIGARNRFIEYIPQEKAA